MSDVKTSCMNILSGINAIIDPAISTISHTNDVTLTKALIHTIIFEIDRATKEAEVLRNRAAYLHGASHALRLAQEELGRSWHRVSDEDSVEGRNQATYSLMQRLEGARGILAKFVDDQNPLTNRTGTP